MSVISPITLKPNTKLVNTLSINDIIDLYSKDLEVDVVNIFKGLKEIYIYECLDTGYLFYYPMNLSGDESFYDDLKRQMPIKYNVSYYSETKWEYEICCKMIKPNDQVYEIGAGNGAFLSILKKNGIDNLYGSELNKKSIETASKKGIYLEYKTIEGKAEETKEEFDVVCTFQVLEHVANVNSFIASSLKILKKGGKLIIAVPCNNPYLFKNDILNTLNLPPHHMGLWGEKAFKNLSKYFPIKLNEIIIEKLPSSGYNFDRYYEVNKDILISNKNPFKKFLDKLYKKYLRNNHLKYDGKNIIACFEKI